MIKIKTLVVVVALAVLSGCSSISVYKSDSLKDIHSYADAKREVKKGMTMGQVRAKFGEYTSQETDNDKTTWRYVSIDSISGLVTLEDHRYITITFDANKRVKSVRYSSKSD